MNRPAIPPDVRTFILQTIPSVPYLEALLLLRSARARSWNAATLARALYLNHAAAVQLIAQMRAAAWVEEDRNDHAAVRYAPPAAAAALLDRLALVYADNLVGVSMLIHSADSRPARPIDSLRG